MFHKKTVMILGAGASYHLGYPTGEDLVRSISSSGYVDKRLQKLVVEMAPISIDMFLSYHREHEKKGKEAVAIEIQKCEAKEQWHRNNLNNYKNTRLDDGDWYRQLLDSLISGCSAANDIHENNSNLTIVTFNYDLSLEYFLHSRLKKISFFKEEVDDYLSNLNILHVYGQLGYFAWHQGFVESSYDEIPPCPRAETHFGDFFDDFHNLKERKIPMMAKGIQVIGHDKSRDSSKRHILTIKERLKEAQNIYFLGFGFLEENLNLIFNNFKPTDSYNVSRMYYTNYGNHKKIKRSMAELARKIKRPIEVIDSIGSVYNALAKDFSLLE